uniref:C-type lectin domain-containing protein n=1 Tax=Gadus morhua TaxID=8049 RepID=A0A8C5BPI6_GADMO
MWGQRNPPILGTVRSQQPDPCEPSSVSDQGCGGASGPARKTESMDRDVEQLLQRLKNVTEQRDSVLRPQDCACGWTKFGCKCYQVTREWGSWNKCRKLCVSHGVDLVVVDSKEEMDILAGTAGPSGSERQMRPVKGCGDGLMGPSCQWITPPGAEGNLMVNCLRRDWGYPNIKWTDESCEASKYGLCEHNLWKLWMKTFLCLTDVSAIRSEL